MARLSVVLALALLTSPVAAARAPRRASALTPPLRGGVVGEGARGRETATATTTTVGPAADLVDDLPGYGAPPAAQYSGFLDASASTPGTMLHYWLALSPADDWASKPIVLWLNGGPGSSSILGFLQENGPLLTNRTGGLMLNPWAWTNDANLLALESPAGVGYSYCAKQLKRPPGGCYNTDKSTASDALAALVHFFGVKFPTLAKNEFFITGESYAGVYVPTLSRAILDHNDAVAAAESSEVFENDATKTTTKNSTTKINLVGLAAGDPCTDNAFQADSMDMLWYGHKYGFVPEEDFDLMWNTCKMRYAAPLARGTWSGREAGEANENQVVSSRSTRARTRWGRGEPVAEVLLPDPDPDDDSEEDVARPRRRRRRPLDKKRDDPRCVAAHRRFLLASSDAFSQDWERAWMNDLSLFGPAAAVRNDIPGTLDYDMSTWMMRADVRKALHVEDAPVDAWPGPGRDWSYASDYAACNADAKKGAESMVDFYRDIAPRLRTTIVFNGDTDPCVSYEGTREAVKAVGFDRLPGGSQRPYFFNATGTTLAVLNEKPLLFGPSLSVVDAGAQFGGHVTSYEHGLSFVTVHGSGHMVPQFRPRVGSHLLRKLLSDAPFSPPFRCVLYKRVSPIARFQHLIASPFN